mmetsp:Transcript_7150/g.31460  ORF Transcript_7150/g.31460 Transcript_7150/m.31460 type:complete len:206 (-) Transcript_7150:73-690(-)
MPPTSRLRVVRCPCTSRADRVAAKGSWNPVCGNWFARLDLCARCPPRRPCRPTRPIAGASPRRAWCRRRATWSPRARRVRQPRRASKPPVRGSRRRVDFPGVDRMGESWMCPGSVTPGAPVWARGPPRAASRSWAWRACRSSRSCATTAARRRSTGARPSCPGDGRRLGTKMIRGRSRLYRRGTSWWWWPWTRKISRVRRRIVVG